MRRLWSRYSQASSAFTILETIVAMGLLSLLMSSLYLLLLYGMRYRQQSEVYQQVHQQANVGLRKITTELAASNISTVSFGASPPHLIFLSLERPLADPNRNVYTYSATGSPEWQKWVCFYVDEAADELWRAEIVPAGVPITLPPAPAPPALSAFQAVAPPDRYVVARNVETMSAGPGAIAQTVDLSVTATELVNSTDATTLTLNTELRVSN